MDPISRNRSVPQNSEIQNQTEQPSTPAKAQQDAAGAKDSFEPTKTDTLRAAYLSGKSEGKTLMSDATFNHVLQTGLTPKQYPEAFKDLKGFVRSNFALTPDQHTTLHLLKDGEVRKFQDAGALAAQLNKPLNYQSTDLDPSNPGPKEMTLEGPVVEDHAVSILAKCSQVQMPNMPNLNLLKS